MGIFRIDGRGRAVLYILVMTASSNVITVVMIRVIAKKTPARGKGMNKMINRLYKKDFYVLRSGLSPVAGIQGMTMVRKTTIVTIVVMPIVTFSIVMSGGWVSETLTRRVYNKVYLNLPYHRSLDEQRMMPVPGC